MTRQFKQITGAAIVFVAVGMFIVTLWATPLQAEDKKKKDIKIVLNTSAERGDAPLPASFVVEIVAPPELDQYIYESSTEWLIEGVFVITNPYTGGSGVDPNMRQNPMSPSEMSLRGQKNLVAKQRNRAPRKKYKPGTEVKRTYEFEYTFEKAGEYYIRFHMRNDRYSSNVVKVVVKGDTSYDPYRKP